jgi:hypothetical protein
LEISKILGIGDWGLGIGDWAQSPIPNPQSPIPILKNTHLYFELLNFILYFLNLILKLNEIRYINHIKIFYFSNIKLKIIFLKTN